jgi:hypothetical protein
MTNQTDGSIMSLCMASCYGPVDYGRLMRAYKVMCHQLIVPLNFLSFAISVESFALKMKPDAVQINWQVRVAGALAGVGFDVPEWAHPVLARDAALGALAKSCRVDAVAAKLALDLRATAFIGALALFAHQAQEGGDYGRRHPAFFATVIRRAARSELPQLAELVGRLLRNLNGCPEAMIREIGRIPDGFFDWRGFLRYACTVLASDHCRGALAGVREVLHTFVELGKQFVRSEREVGETAAFVMFWRLIGKIERTDEITEFVRVSQDAGVHPELVAEAVAEIESDRPAARWPLRVWLPDVTGKVVILNCL